MPGIGGASHAHLRRVAILAAVHSYVDQYQDSATSIQRGAVLPPATLSPGEAVDHVGENNEQPGL